MWIPNVPVTLVTGVAAVVGGMALYKDRRSGPPFDREARADGKVVLVTGASSGIGEQATREFAQRGAKVFMACRDMEKCEKIRREVVLESGNKFVYCRPCDLASGASIRQFVQRFKSEEPHLHILVNNAGVMEYRRSVTADGVEATLGVNHMGHFLLTNLLLDTVKESAPSRIVIVSSDVHAKGTINKQDLNLSQKYDGREAYYQSKLANVLFGLELARRLVDTGVAVSIVDPGLADTNLTRNLPMSKSISRYFIYPLFWSTMKNPRMASQPVIHAALDPSTADAKGDYYVGMQKGEPAESARDPELAQWLWKVSEKWTKLSEHLDHVKNSPLATNAG